MGGGYEMGGIDPRVLRARLEDLDVEVSERTDGESRLTVDPAKALVLLGRLRDDPETAMRRLVDLTAIDRSGQAGQEARFEMIYRLHSPDLNERIRIHVPVEASTTMVDSVVAIWPAADWLEREVFDLFGIRFRGHPDLRRILLETDFEGAPLRKDYPRQPNLALPKGAER
jgi:NADH-quinone oxidoreductase subunit C